MVVTSRYFLWFCPSQVMVEKYVLGFGYFDMFYRFNKCSWSD